MSQLKMTGWKKLSLLARASDNRLFPHMYIKGNYWIDSYLRVQLSFCSIFYKNASMCQNFLVLFSYLNRLGEQCCVYKLFGASGKISLRTSTSFETFNATDLIYAKFVVYITNLSFSRMSSSALSRNWCELVTRMWLLFSLKEGKLQGSL